MRLSNETIHVLKNFSGINNSILVRPGNVLTVRNIAGNVQAAAVVEETFPVEFGINDVVRFNQLLNMFDDHEIVFEDNFLTVTSGQSSARVVYGNAEAIATTKKSVLPGVPADFYASAEFNTESIEKVITGAKILSIPVISFIGKDGVLKIVARDVKNDSAGKYEQTICDIDDSLDFSLDYRADTLRLITGDYTLYAIKTANGIQSLIRNDSRAYAIGPEFTSYIN